MQTENYWVRLGEQEGGQPQHPAQRDNQGLQELAAHHAQPRRSAGGIIASCDSDIMQFNRDTYSYIWTRDGAIAAMAFDLAGFREVSCRFFRFCNSRHRRGGLFSSQVLARRVCRQQLAAFGWLKGDASHRGGRDRLVLYALWRHFQKYRDIEFIESVPNLILKTTEFLLDYLDPDTGLPRPCFDLWEERWGVFTWTAATVYAALNAAAKFRRVIYDRERYETLSRAAANLREAMLKRLYDPESNRFIKAVYPDGSRDLAVDSSASAVFLYGGFDASGKAVEGTMNSIRDRLWIGTQVGGLARYENDEYQRVSRDVPGNPWFICTLWLARWHIARAASLGQLKEGLELLTWAARHSLSSGVMAEQIHPYTGVPVSVSPLIWSHAEFVIAVCEYLEKHREISSTMLNSGLKER